MQHYFYFTHKKTGAQRGKQNAISIFHGPGTALDFCTPVRFLPVPSDRGSTGRVPCVTGSDIASWGQSQAWSPGLSCILSCRASSGYPRLRCPVVRNGGQLGTGFRVAPGPQLSCFCSVLSPGPFVLLPNNNNRNHNHPLWVQYFYTLFLI